MFAWELFLIDEWSNVIDRDDDDHGDDYDDDDGDDDGLRFLNDVKFAELLRVPVSEHHTRKRNNWFRKVSSPSSGVCKLRVLNAAIWLCVW